MTQTKRDELEKVTDVKRLAKQIATDLQQYYQWGFKEALHCEEVTAMRKALILMLSVNEDSVYFASCAQRVEAFDKLVKGEM